VRRPCRGHRDIQPVPVFPVLREGLPVTKQATLPIEHPRPDPASEQGRRARPVRARLTRVSAIVAVLGLALLFGPWVRGGLGARSTGAFENRKLATMPALTSGWRFFPRLDNMGGRQFPAQRRCRAPRVPPFLRRLRAVAQVRDRRGGLRRPYRRTFRRRSGPSSNGHRWGHLRAKWRAVPQPGLRARMPPAYDAGPCRPQPESLGCHRGSCGGRLIDTVAPDKTAIEPGLLPVSSPEQSCGRSGQLAFWSAITARPPPGYFDAYDAVRSYASTAHAQVYAQL